jgi:hypothetical protein
LHLVWSVLFCSAVCQASCRLVLGSVTKMDGRMLSDVAALRCISPAEHVLKLVALLLVLLLLLLLLAAVAAAWC